MQAIEGKTKPIVLIGGSEVGKINHISLDQPYDGHHFFSVVCSLKEESNSIVTLSEKYIGKDITINLEPGWADRVPGKLEFLGLVTNVKLSKHESALMQIVIQGFSTTRKLDDGPHYQSWEKKTLDAVAGEVVGKYGIDMVKDITFQDEIPYICQYDETSFQFLRRKMASYGQWCYYDGKALVLGAPASGSETELVFGKNMHALDVSADIIPTDFKLLGYDYVEDKHFDSDGKSASVSSFDSLGNIAMKASTEAFPLQPLNVEQFYVSSKGQLDDHATRRKSGQGAQFVNLFGESSHLGLKLGQVIVVRSEEVTTGRGASGGDYGAFRLIHITHAVDAQGNYENRFQAIPAKLEMPPNQDHKLRPPLAETQPAEVLDNKDPDGLGRVKVQFPWQKDEGAETPWIRVSTAGAGGGHGNYFVPEIGDQVLIGFTWNNPDRPIVVGSLYNKTTKHADAYTAENNTKIIRTRSGNQIALSDESGKESIVITNGTNVITMSLDGDTSIKIETIGDLIMKGKTVSITAEESLTVNSETTTMSSSAKTSISAGSDMEIKATKTADVKAMDVAVKATKSLKASGTATADLEGGNTNVKGTALVNVTAPIVKLN